MRAAWRYDRRAGAWSIGPLGRCDSWSNTVAECQGEAGTMGIINSNGDCKRTGDADAVKRPKMVRRREEDRERLEDDGHRTGRQLAQLVEYAVKRRSWGDRDHRLIRVLSLRR